LKQKSTECGAERTPAQQRIPLTKANSTFSSFFFNFAGYPGLRAAVTFALRAVGEERPADPIAALANKLLEFQAANPDNSQEGTGRARALSLKKESARSASPSSSRRKQKEMSSSAGASKGMPSSPRPGDTEDDAAEAAKLAAARSRGKNRRMVVFSEPVRLDKEFKPTIIPKSDEQKAEIEAVLASNILFKGMDSDARNLIVDAMDSKSFAKGDIIIKQGDPGDFYYVVSEGTCDILVNGK
jgi:hypothetical protein